MGTTSEKLTYLNVTKQKLKQAINNIGGEVTDETTFRQYVNQLENAYDRLPKTEFEEGESVTLENTLKGKLDFQDGKVGFGQASQETTQGYNLVDISSGTTSSLVGVSTSISGDIVTINGSRTDGSTSNAVRIINEINKFNISSSDTYKMTLNVISGTYTGRVGLTFLNSSGTTLAYIETATSGTTASKSLTFSEQISKISFFFNGDFSANNFKFQIMLQKGTSNVDYEKYTGGYSSPSPNWEQEVKCVAGRNILKDSGWERKTASNDVTQIQDSTTRIMSDYIEVDEHLNYYATIQSTNYCYINVVLYNANKVQFNTYYNAVSQSINGTRSIELNFPTNTKYVRVVVRNADNTSEVTLDELATIKPMLEQGTSASPYLPYNTIEETIGGKNEYKPTLTYNDVAIRQANCSVTLNDDEFTFVASGADMRFGDIISTGSFQNMLGYLIEIPENGTNVYLLTTNNEFDKCFVGWYDSNKVTLGFQSITTSKAIPSGAKYCNFRIGKSDSVNGTSYATKIMVAFSSIDTYEPYITPKTYQLSLGDKKLYDECTIVGSPDNWKYVDNYAKKTMSGSDIVFLTSGVSVGTNYRYILQFNEAIIADKAWCTYAPFLKDYGRDSIHFYLHTGQFILFVPLTGAELVAKANETPIEIVYPLATPIETPITDETLISQLNAWYNAHSNNGTTIITSNGNLPLVIKVRGLKGES